MQWISVGSGIEHAEGGGTPAGEVMEGFQIWINVPSDRKMDDPRYGVEPPENIPVLNGTAVSPVVC
jgi:redox-sensitive bicupin YhaK (pirin superfamily)